MEKNLLKPTDKAVTNSGYEWLWRIIINVKPGSAVCTPRYNPNKNPSRSGVVSSYNQPNFINMFSLKNLINVGLLTLIMCVSLNVPPKHLQALLFSLLFQRTITSHCLLIMKPLGDIFLFSQFIFKLIASL